MVRTVDFHSTNVGSIPASLIMLINNNYQNHIQIFNKINNKLFFKTKLKYSLSFVSLISPSSVSSIRLIFNNNNMNSKNKKLLVKQSYMLLTWLFYLNKNNPNNVNKSAPSFFIQPFNQSKFTLIKSPMAHKTFSQEQYMISHYKLTVSFNFSSSSFKNFSYLDSLNKSLMFALILRQSFLNFETNFFFLQKIRFNFLSSDSNFFKLY